MINLSSKRLAALVSFWVFVLPTSMSAALLTLDNGAVKVGVDTAYGGAITYLSQSGSATNFINSHDLGREVQQSYYSGPSNFIPAGATQHASWSPWPWNPIQAGDVYLNRPTVLASSNTGGVIYVKTQPMQWALKNVPGDCIFEWWVRLEGSAVRVHCRLTNMRRDPTQYPASSQELPAVYGVGTLNRVFSYTGTAPFTGGAMTQLPSVGPPWSQWRATENWSAIVNSSDFGLGVHHPDAVFTTGGYYSTGNPGTGDPSSPNTGYLAPIHQEVLDANLVYEYDFNLILGTLTDIRSWVYAHASDHRPAWRFASDRGHWAPAANLGDAGPPAGFLRQNVNGSDPQLRGPYCAFRASDVATIYFSARYNMASPPPGPFAELFWETNNAGGLAGTRAQRVGVTPAGGWRIYSIPVGTHAAWTGLISMLRLDLVQGGAGTDTVDLGGISWKNDPPVVSGLAGLTVNYGSAAPTQSFSVTDDLVPEEALSVTATSSNPTLLPNSGIQLTGTGSNRRLSLTPAAGQYGIATITVSAHDTALSGSQSFTAEFLSPPGTVPPVITSPPTDQAVASGDSVLFSLTASGTPAPTFQWRKNGVAIPGATTSILRIDRAQPADAGSYSVVVANAVGSVTGDVGTLTVAFSRLINLSVLASLTSADDSFTLGYVVGGVGTSGAKPLVIRAVGPSLAAFGVPFPHADPRLELFAGATKVGENDNWGGAANLADAMAAVGAFVYAGPTSRDAAVAWSVASGDNSVRVSGGSNGTGAVMAEIYDATPAAGFTGTTARLINVSVLKQLGPGFTVGFVLGGSGAKNVLVRAIGPTLGGAFSVGGAVDDPLFTLYSGPTVVAANDNWGGGAALASAFSSVGAFSLPTGSRDAAVVARLNPGNYTVQVSGGSGATGLILVEIYELP